MGVSLDWLTGDDTAPPVVAAPTETAALSVKLYAGSRGDTRQRIIAAAWLLIAERGLHAVRVSDVADQCQVSSATVHYHFRNRRVMLEEALRVSVQNAYDRQSADLESIDDALERLLHLLELQLPNSESLLLEWSIWLQVWAQAALDPRIREVHTAAYERWQSTVRTVIEFGQQQGVFILSNAGQIALRLTALVDGLGIQLVAGRPDYTVESMREILHDFVRTEIVAKGRD